jgi:hypothetical protein
MSEPPLPLFNPHASTQLIRFDERHFCLKIDDALLNPDELAQFAMDRRAEFSAVDFNYYPGVYLMAPDPQTQLFAEYFQMHARRHFDARRCLETVLRYSMVTLPTHALRPLQWICHRDDVGLDPRLSMQASVLYLFRDPALGGTGFYAALRNVSATGALFADARRLTPAAFSEKYAIAPAYLHEGNAWFRRVGGVAARWNRLIIYDGGMLHASDIAAPELLSADPDKGRLTLNGFFTSRRHVV